MSNNRVGKCLGNKNAKRCLTEAAVVDIKRNYLAFIRGRSLPHFGAKYGVSIETVRKVVQGKTWKHVQVPA